MRMTKLSNLPSLSKNSTNRMAHKSKRRRRAMKQTGAARQVQVETSIRSAESGQLFTTERTGENDNDGHHSAPSALACFDNAFPGPSAQAIAFRAVGALTHRR